MTEEISQDVLDQNNEKKIKLLSELLIISVGEKNKEDASKFQDLMVAQVKKRSQAYVDRIFSEKMARILA